MAESERMPLCMKIEDSTSAAPKNELSSRDASLYTVMPTPHAMTQSQAASLHGVNLRSTHTARRATQRGPKARSTWLRESSMRVREALFAATASVVCESEK